MDRLQVIQELFQSLDWVDVFSDFPYQNAGLPLIKFQSLDWVDVFSDVRNTCFDMRKRHVSIPRLG